MHCIQFHGDAEQAVTYYRITETGKFTEKTEASSLRTLAPFPSELPVAILLPTSRIFLTTMDLPQVSKREMQLAVPFAMEEQFIENVSELYFAMERSEKTKLISVAVMGKKLFESYFSLLQELNLHAELFLPDVLALPWSENQWTLAQVDNLVLLRTSESQGIAIDPQNILLGLETAANDGASLPEKIILYGKINDISIPELNAAYPGKIETVETVTDVFFSAEAIENPGLNLLQGSYRPKPKLSRLQKYWRWCSYLAILILFLIVVRDVVDYFYFQWEGNHLQKEIKTLYTDVFAGAAVPNDIQSSMQSALAKLAARAGDNTFDQLFRPVGLILHENADVSLRGFDYHHGHLLIIITAKTQAAAQAFIQSLNQQGFSTRIEKTKATGDVAVGMELSIQKSTSTEAPV